MRKSGVALGLVVAVCAFGVVAAPALGFGKFFASIKGKTISEAEPGKTKGKGELIHLRLGPYDVKCTKIASKSTVTSEGPSESFFQEVTFFPCETSSGPGGGSGIEEIKDLHFKLGMEFLSNFAAKAGEAESEVRVVQPGSVSVKSRNSTCVVLIPTQSIPVHTKPEHEYEAALPETEEEELTQPMKIAKFGPVRKRLRFEFNFKDLKTEVKTNARCVYKGGEEGKFNPETGNVAFPDGSLEGNLEKITLEGGNVWFEEE